MSPKSLLSLIGFFETRHLIGLRALASLDDVELYFIAFFEALIALALNGTVMDEDIGPTVAAQETVAFSVVEPLNRTFILCHFATPFFASSRMVHREVKAFQRLRHWMCDANTAAGVFWKRPMGRLFMDMARVACNVFDVTNIAGGRHSSSDFFHGANGASC